MPDSGESDRFAVRVDGEEKDQGILPVARGTIPVGWVEDNASGLQSASKSLLTHSFNPLDRCRA